MFSRVSQQIKVTMDSVIAVNNNSLWDAELGVWKGEKASSTVDWAEIPTPLYIFGYGSLIWNPGAYLKDCDTAQCTAIGWKRVFAQRSCDHRGTTKFPGLVLNLVNETDLKALGYVSTAVPECAGMVWYVPEDKAHAVIEDLDYRERGGYERHTLSVKLDADTVFHRKGEIVQALVYTGPQSNPNFYLPPLDNEVSVTDEHAPFPNINHLFNLRRRNVVTDIIAAAHGPSGANIDYLFSLERFLSERRMHDPYLALLADSVLLRLGAWRNRAYHRHHRSLQHSQHISQQSASTEQPVAQETSQRLVGWGSNEFHQLSAERAPAYLNSLVDHHYLASELAELQPGDSAHTHRYYVSAGGASSALLVDGRLTVWGLIVPQIRKSISAIRDQGSSDSSSMDSESSIVIDGCDGIALGHDHCLVLLSSGHVAGFGDDAHGQLSGAERHPLLGGGKGCAGEDRVFISALDLVLELSEEFKESSGTGDHHSLNKCSRSYSIRSRNSAQEAAIVAHRHPSISVLKLAAGVRHSAAVTADGRLLTWGDRAHGQVLGGTGWWRPPNSAHKVIDVACGAKHTVAVDSDGNIYSFGSIKYGAIGRRLSVDQGDASNSCSNAATRKSKSCDQPALVEGLPEGVRWQHVVCGWSHVLARGLLPDGQLVTVGWGRSDMGQLPVQSSESDTEHSGSNQRNHVERVHVLTLPSGRQIAEVWCGSEYSLVSDVDGRVWGSGWNEHGNLGNGDPTCTNVLSGWQPVRKFNGGKGDSDVCDGSENGHGEQLTLPLVWEGALACGGGHVVCLV